MNKQFREFVSLCWLSGLPVTMFLPVAKDYHQFTEIIKLYSELDNTYDLGTIIQIPRRIK